MGGQENRRKRRRRRETGEGEGGKTRSGEENKRREKNWVGEREWRAWECMKRKEWESKRREITA